MPTDDTKLFMPSLFIPKRRKPLRIGLVNNMPDAALRAIERQFAELIASAARMLGFGFPTLTLSLFHINEIPRNPEIAAELAATSADVAAIEDADLDGLVVTGGEALAPNMRAEPQWAKMAALIDFTVARKLPVLWSCRAAHAAVLHLDGIERVRLTDKLSGVFQTEMVGDAPVMRHLAGNPLTPESRYNTLDTAQLRAKDYVILTQSAETGPDWFVRVASPHMLFVQGHPEYNANALGLEYRRDVRRFMKGEAADHPALPANYFSPALRQRLLDLAATAIQRRDPALLHRLDDVLATHTPRQRWRETAVELYAGWLEGLATKANPAVIAA